MPSSAKELERLALHEKHTPFTVCTACGSREFKDVQETEKQWSGKCAKCGMEHIAGYPASTYPTAEGPKGRRGKRSEGEGE